MLNPYITEYPTTPKTFAGRKKELNIFCESLKQTIESYPPSPKNVAIVGDWGIGKTSILNKFMEIAKTKKCHVIKMTLTPEKCRNMEQFVLSIIDEIHQSIWDSSSFSTKVKEEISKWKLSSINLAVVGTKRPTTVVPPSSLLKSSLLKLSRLLKSLPAIILIFDDMQYLMELNPKGLYDIRGVFQDLREASARIMLIISGTKEMFLDIRGHSEPLLRFFEHIELNSFNTEETVEAINIPLQINKISLKITDKVVQKIYQKTRGHPYFVVFIAHDIFEHKSTGRINIDYFNSIYSSIFEHLSAARFIKDISIASEKEKKVLSTLAKGKTSPDKIKVPNASLYLKRLNEKKLIVKLTRGEYAVYHPLFGEYIKKYKNK